MVVWLGGDVPNDHLNRQLNRIMLRLASDLAGYPRPMVQHGAQRRKPVPLQMFKSRNWAPGSPDRKVIFACHGNGRNHIGSARRARTMAERFNAIVVAPRFAAPVFPNARYHGAGLLNGSAVRDEEYWTPTIVERILDEIRWREGDTNLKAWVIGHSAGGQFVHRAAMIRRGSIERWVAGNSGTYYFLNGDYDWSLGYGNLPSSFSEPAALQAALAPPLMVYIGTADTVDHTEDSDVSSAPGAVAQGNNRYERAQNFYAIGAALAVANSWEFGWTYVEAEGIAQSEQGLYSRQVVEEALFPAE